MYYERKEKENEDMQTESRARNDSLGLDSTVKQTLRKNQEIQSLRKEMAKEKNMKAVEKIQQHHKKPVAKATPEPRQNAKLEMPVKICFLFLCEGASNLS